MGQTSDLLVIILILLIVAVILDGLRRKWRGRGERVVMKLDKSFLRNNEVSEPEEALPNSELPNGGARTVTRTGDVPVSRKPAPKLKQRRKDAASTTATAAEGGDKPGHDAVPVLMDTVELEETTIEHANVFVSAQAPQQFAPELFEDEASSGRVRSNAVEGSEMLDVQMEELEKPGGNGIAPSAGRNPAYDDDEDDFDEDDEDFDDEDDDEDDWDDEDEDDDDYEDDDEGKGYPRRRHADDDDDDEDEDEDDDWDDDDWDEDDDEDDEDDDEDEDDEDEDDWDDEDEEEQYSGDYENEPTLLEETYARAASHFARPEPAAEIRIEPGFGDAGEEPPVDAEDEEVLLEDFDESFLQDEPLFAEPVSGLEPAPETARTEATPEPQAKGVDGEAARGRTGRSERTERAERAERTEHMPFFGKSLLGRQQQKELFEEEAQAAAGAAATEADSEEAEGPTEVLIINVMARQGYHFFGEDLLPVLRQQGMQLGEMSIFHRHENVDGSGRVVFSMANMVKPGTFDLAQMEQFSTPGLSLFLQLPNRYGNMQSFELMLATANALRDGLDGELKDENRSVFTRQTIEHSRQRIRDFELSLLSRK